MRGSSSDRRSDGSCSRLPRRSTVGLGAVSVVVGFSESFPVSLFQGVAVFAAGAVILGGVVLFALVHLAGWREPESEADFDKIVERAERLAAEGRWGESRARPDDDDEFALSTDEDFQRPRALRDRRAAARVPPRA